MYTAAATAATAETWNVVETGRKRAAMVPKTKPAVQTPENTPKAAALRVSGTLSATYASERHCMLPSETMAVRVLVT
uniref:Uncharacterized protein n=1 Tax=Arundo donax TaxID=35708 RepID=A0A0A9G0I5_ARUDO